MGSQKKMSRILAKAPLPPAHGRRHVTFSSVTAARLFAILLILLGIACMAFTELIHALFPFILGILMQAIGICQIYRAIMLKEYENEETKLTSNGIVMVILGGVILYHYRDADPIIGAVWGVIGLAKGSETLNLAIYQGCKKKPYIRQSIHGLVELVLGILLLIDPDEAVRHHVFILGIELCAVGLQSVIETKRELRKAHHTYAGIGDRDDEKPKRK